MNKEQSLPILSRRDFLKLLAAAGITVAGEYALYTYAPWQAYDEQANQIRKPFEKDATMSAQMRELVRYATLAASGHNTQLCKFAIQENADEGLTEVSGRLNHFLDQLARAELLIVDELGYLSLTKQTARLFFQLVSKRYEKGSIIITSNKPFEQWGEIFADEVVAAAILDRLLHHSYPFIINGKSYRMKNIAKTN